MNYFEKPFVKKDIIIFIIVILLVATTFLVNIKSQSSQGFTVYIDGEVVLTYDFTSDKGDIVDSEIVKSCEGGYTITSNYGYNTILIDSVNKNVKVVDTDCGITKECQMMDFLSSGVIICSPHHLVIKKSGSIIDPKVG